MPEVATACDMCGVNKHLADLKREENEMITVRMQVFRVERDAAEQRARVWEQRCWVVMGLAACVVAKLGWSAGLR